MNPRYTAQKRPGVGGPQIQDDEPYMVIRAQDILAPVMMQRYIDLYVQFEEAQDEVIEELRQHLADLIEWQCDHAEKIKVADR